MAAAAMLAGSAMAGEFVRVKETADRKVLQTAVCGYERDGVEVELIGAVHLADRRYYEFLNRHFKKYEVLLFEMVGGEAIGRKMRKVEGEPHAGVRGRNDLGGLGRFYENLEKALGLAGQSSVIDYTVANFVHADLTAKEFREMQEERGESLLGFVIGEAIAAKDSRKDPDGMKLMRGLISGRKDLVKGEIMESLAADLDELGKGRREIGIFYGGAHFPWMEKRLLEMGFKRTGKQWLSAWAIRKG